VKPTNIKKLHFIQKENTMRNISLMTLLGLPLSGCLMESYLYETTDTNLDSVNVLGVTPAEHFSDENHEDYGLATVSLGGIFEGTPTIPHTSGITVESGDGTVEIEDTESYDGSAHGDLALLVDGSGSLECLGDCCEGCPTDPDRYRVDAIKMIATTIGECGSDWRLALLEFAIQSSEGYTDTEVIVPYTDDVGFVGASANQLSSWYDTPLWDSLMETIEGIDEALQAEDSRRKKGLVLFSDGEDTESWHTLEDVIQKAQEVKLSVHVVALGHSSDLMDAHSPQAIKDLRSLATETRGYYASVSDSSELPNVSSMVAKSFCEGYSNLNLRFSNPAESNEMVKGDVVLFDTISAPFKFRSPEF